MSRLKIPVILAVGIAAIAWLLASGVSKNDIYMTTLDAFDAARAQRESIRVMGFVKDDSIQQVEDALVTNFVLRNESGEKTLPVRFKGVTPGLFRSGTNVIASGRMGNDGVFHATDLMTKCPSKYEGLEAPPGMTMPGHPGSPPAAAPTAASQPVGT